MHRRILPLSRNQAPRLWQTVDRLATQLNTPVPDLIWVGLEPSFFTAKIPSKTSHIRLLYLSLPLLRVLTLEEFEAVLAHELTHLSGNTWLRLSHRIAMQRVFILIRSLSRKWLRKIPTQHQHEFEADRKSATLFGPELLAKALIKIHQSARFWPSTQAAMKIAQRHQTRVTNASRFLQIITKVLMDEAKSLLQFSRMQASLLELSTQTHPSLSERIRALSLSPDLSLSEEFIIPKPIEAAIRLIPELERLETRLTQLENEYLQSFD